MALEVCRSSKGTVVTKRRQQQQHRQQQKAELFSSMETGTYFILECVYCILRKGERERGREGERERETY